MWEIRITGIVARCSRITDVPMSRKKNRNRKLTGHYCWACDRRRPNEKFSGPGHARHLCRECAKLGAEELAYRQACRDLERCITWEGIIPRKRRESFDRFLDHGDPRIRAMAEEMRDEDRASRTLMRAAELEEVHSETSQEQICNDCGEDDDWLTEIPF